MNKPVIHAAKKVAGAIVLLSIMLGSFGAGCAASSSDSSPTSEQTVVATGSVDASHASFEGWLRGICPSGFALRVADVKTSKSTDIACEAIHERAGEEGEVRELLLHAYRASTASSGNEHIGEAPQDLTPLGGLLCGVIAAFPGLLFNYGSTGKAVCNDPRLTREEQERCSAATGIGSTALGILCAIAAFF